MRLLVATPLYPPEPGGPATYARTLEEELPGQGIEVSLVKFSDVRHLPKLLRHLAYAWKVFKASKEADLILVLDPVSTGLPAAAAAFVRRVPYVVKVVGDYAWEQGCQRYGVSSALDAFVHERTVPPQVSLLRMVQRTVARGARRVLVPSEYLKRIVRVWGVPDERIMVIYNAVRFEEPGAVPDAVAALSRPRIVTAGRLVPWKGIGGVIAAVAELREDIPDISLVVIGDGPDRGQLESYARARLGGGYQFTGLLSHQDTLAVIQDADLFVLNSTYEGLSHLLIEALSLGKPVVATNVGGNPELIEDGVSGVLVASKDADGLRSAVRDLLTNTGRRAALSEEARKVGQRFSVQTMIEGTAAFLRDIV